MATQVLPAAIIPSAPAAPGPAPSIIRTPTPINVIDSFPVLTEEVGYPPSPVARPSGMPAAIPGSAPLGQIAMKAISDVLGWKVKCDLNGDPKGFLGALNASFSLKQVEGHTEAIWTPRTYAVQTDLSGGITGAQASVYKRAKEALDQSLPLLDGLYPLFKEAKDEDIAALRATLRSQFTDLVSELGLLGGPRIARVNQLFFLLLGQTPQTGVPIVTDPDQVGGTLGNLRIECGFGKDDDQVNTVEDEQDVTNFRIVSDYLTSLAQSWLNNLPFFGLNTTTPFFGTQLVLLSRQLSVVAESANEVRFTLDSVFVGPAERQTLQITFGSPASSAPPMFLEDLLTWIDSFASEEGPRLIQEGGKFAVGQSFVPIAQQLLQLVQGRPIPQTSNQPIPGLPPGYATDRVQNSFEDLSSALQQLLNLAAPISHVITPEPEPELAVLGINPVAIFLSAWPRSATAFQSLQITIIGTGFDVVTPAGSILEISTPPELDFGNGLGNPGSVTINSDNLASASLRPNSSIGPQALPPAGSYTVQITMPNRDPLKSAQPFVLVTSLTILP